MHRYEKSGALSGLQRVREMTLNDGHTFVRPDQIKDEFKRTLELMAVYADFNITDYRFRLSIVIQIIQTNILMMMRCGKSASDVKSCHG